MKHVRESLNEYYDFKFFKIFEEDEKTNLKDKEKDGLKIIEKIKKNFEDFKKDSKGKISAYKLFWEENQSSKQAFSQSGSLYKMFNSDYIIGILELKPKTLSDGSLDGGLGASDEPQEEIIEGKEITQDNEENNSKFIKEHWVTINEAEEDINLDLNPKDDESDIDLDVKDEHEEDDSNVDLDTESNKEDDMDMNLDSNKKNLTSPQTYFVVYDISGEGREEIFRCGSNNVINTFKEFYNDTFKASMKNAIIKYKELKQKEKMSAEKSQKKKQEKQKDSKLRKFLDM